VAESRIQSHHFPAGHKFCTASCCGRRGSAGIPLNCRVVGWGRCKLRWSTGLDRCHWCLHRFDHYPGGVWGRTKIGIEKLGAVHIYPCPNMLSIVCYDIPKVGVEPSMVVRL
jgi:hypothetical protein